MHPQLYLKTFWRLELKPTIFVAMSFADRYKARFKDGRAQKPRATFLGEHVAGETSTRSGVLKNGR
jgi:hypothetical protein